VTDFDVLIAGSGPAGCATALSLAAFAPELRVGLIAAPETGEERIGETVPPQISPVLIHLGLWDAFSRGGHCPSYRTIAAWGDSQLGGNEFLLHAHQVGWRLDRPAFDRMLVEAASARVAAFIQAKVVSLARETADWRVSLFDGTRPTADFLVDATGRAAALARRCGLRPVNIDRLVGCSLRVGSRSDGTEGLMIESCAEGWWYTAAIPSGDRVIVCMTDADRVRPLGLSSGRGFTRLFAETCHVRRVAILEGVGRPLIWPAGSRFFDNPTALPLLCVGDAAVSFDPISGDGIVRALRSGVFASYAIADWLRRSDPRGLSRYHHLQKREFTSYCRMVREYYARERRWPDNQFWRRRIGRWPEPARLCAS
jgi:2-polyprenyl-6-methoxyphenol hydroxylase-like FAD-dependent oxidoreductase